MLDFTSALYLDMEHPSRSLAPWRALTTGVPAALHAAPAACTVARRLAALQGCEAATLAPSTLHIAVDLFEALGARRRTILLDGGRTRSGGSGWSSRPPAARGWRRSPATTSPPCAARSRAAPPGATVVADAYAGLGPAPVRPYLESVRERGGGLLVLDDTQALGLMGAGRRRLPA